MTAHHVEPPPHSAQALPAGPLAGIRILDLTSVAMGPLATQWLGDMGADIVKVEPRQGDVFRQAAAGRNPGMGSSFLNFNRNKRSIVLDMKTPEGSQALQALASVADVLVYSLRPQSMRRLGLDYATLSQQNPRLIYCGAYGFSERGPYAGRPAYDDIIQAMSGLATIQSDRSSGEPAYVNAILADKITGLVLANAVALALYERTQSGCGQEIEVPMFETMATFNLLEHMVGATYRPAQGKMGYARLLSEHRRPYRTRDGHIAVMPYTTAQWQRFFVIAGRPDIAEHQDVIDPVNRAKHIGTLYGLLANVVATRSTQEWLALLAVEDIPHAPVATLEDLLQDPHLRATGMIQDAQHPTEGEIVNLGIPVTFSRTPGTIRRQAPNLGEHRSQDILQEWRRAAQA